MPKYRSYTVTVVPYIQKFWDLIVATYTYTPTSTTAIDGSISDLTIWPDSNIKSHKQKKTLAEEAGSMNAPQ